MKKDKHDDKQRREKIIKEMQETKEIMKDKNKRKL
jgi:hypothetical protein